MRCLILNSSYEFLNVTPSWFQGVRLLAKDRIKPLVSYQKVVKAGREDFQIPAVAVLKHYAQVGRRRQSFTLPTHKNILVREGMACAYCGHPLTLNSVTKDHVVPRSKGGKDDLLNVVACCTPCNGKKADKTVAEAGLKLRVQPRHLTNDEKLSVLLKCQGDAIERKVWNGWLEETGMSLF